MPALKMYGRTWYTTTDMLPLPAGIFSIISAVWLAVFIPLIAGLDVWRSCRGQGVHYVVTMAGLVAVFGLTLLLMLGVCVCGSRGACFEVGKRRGAVALLYVQSFVWGVQAVLMIYGTVIMYTAEPSCWNLNGHSRALRNLTHAVVYSIWGLIVFTLGVVWIVYDSYQDQDSLKAWERRLLRLARCLQCRDNLSASDGRAGEPLPSIAQWISKLFAGVDLSPSDLSEAVVLTAAMQSLRREVQLKQALAPAIEAAGGEQEQQDPEQQLDVQEESDGGSQQPEPASALERITGTIAEAAGLARGSRSSHGGARGNRYASGGSSHASGGGSRAAGEGIHPDDIALAVAEELAPPELGREADPPPLITPSGKTAEAAGHALPADATLEEAVGERQLVPFPELEEAAHWIRYSAAAYAVQPYSDPSVITRGVCGRRPVTEESVQDSILELAGIRPEELLYFSHSNTALAHLPYLLALDTERKAVVLAIRGTMSLADLVTDAVVQPQPLADWALDPDGRQPAKGRGGLQPLGPTAHAHAGISSAAESLLADLQVHGMLGAMLHAKEGAAGSSGGSDGGGASGSGSGGSSSQEGGEGPRVDRGGGARSGGVWPEGAQRASERRQQGSPRHSPSGRDGGGGGSVGGREDSDTQRGRAVGNDIRDKLDNQGWQLLITGHSLGGGAATLVGIKLRQRYPDLRVWAFSPPGGLVSSCVVPYTAGWVTSVVAGKDLVPRMTVQTLERLMEEMVTSLAFCRHHKLRVLLGRWWYNERRPPPQSLFHTEASMPAEARHVLQQYRAGAQRRECSGMFPPGRVIFVRPVKLPTGTRVPGEPRRTRVAWDAVWITPQELVAEGILVSRKMLVHHSIEQTVMGALGYALRHHPANPEPPRERKRQKRRQKELQSELRGVRLETEGSNEPHAVPSSQRGSL